VFLLLLWIAIAIAHCWLTCFRKGEELKSLGHGHGLRARCGTLSTAQGAA